MTAPLRLHWEAGCSCLQLQQTCAHLQWGNVHQPSLPLQNHSSDSAGKLDLDGPDLAVYITHMPFFVISAVPSEAVWGKGHQSTKWSKPPHLKHLWAEALTAVASRIVTHQGLVHCGEGAAVVGAQCMEPNVVHLNCRPNDFLS